MGRILLLLLLSIGASICVRALHPKIKNPRIFSLSYFHLASSWSMIPTEVVSQMKLQGGSGANYLAIFLDLWVACHSWSGSLHTCLTCFWGSKQFPQLCDINDFQPANVTRFHHHSQKLTQTLEHGLTRAWGWLLFSTLLLLRALASRTVERVGKSIINVPQVFQRILNMTITSVFFPLLNRPQQSYKAKGTLKFH